MSKHFRANLRLLASTLLMASVIYPLLLLAIGQTVFHDKVQGSLVLVQDGKVIGSWLIAQPFSGDEYFQPRPSAASYNAAASGATNWGANNYLLRERVARQIGPIVKYQGGAKLGQLVGPDVETWFQQDKFDGMPGIVGQWAQAHNTLAVNWVKAEKLNAEYVTAWQQSHPEEMAQWLKDNPSNSELKPADLAVVFFTSFSKEHPGKFPSAVEQPTADGKTEKKIELVQQGTDIQGIFFDMWRNEHADANLEPVPADMVMASGSGLDPHITLQNALYQLDRVAARWAENTKRDQTEVRKQIEALLREQSAAPLGGLVGVPLVNVLEVNLALRELYGLPVP